jgi:hypothetical protein
MNWSSIKCFFNGHDWDWNKEDIDWVSSHGKKITITSPVRICQNCYKKQRYNNGNGWSDWDRLSKEESRDKKLRELGI